MDSSRHKQIYKEDSLKISGKLVLLNLKIRGMVLKKTVSSKTRLRTNLDAEAAK